MLSTSYIKKTVKKTHQVSNNSQKTISLKIKMFKKILSKISLKSFRSNHSLAKAFVRKRKLPFKVVLLLILQKSVKSIQLVLNEFFLKVDSSFEPATASALCQARDKLLHGAFIELNEDCVVPTFYEDGDYKKYKNHRVMAIDGSKIILPNEKEIIEHFGTFNISNQHKRNAGEYAAGLASVCYDVLNRIAVDSILSHSHSYEVDLACGHLASAQRGDLFLIDRGYISYYFLATLIKQGFDFVGRCSTGSFKEAQKLFHQQIESKTVTLQPNPAIKGAIKEQGLPEEITVRFVRVVLSTGEVEVLVTSLLDEELYPYEDFKYLYGLRWGVETFYGIIKGRLSLENFTGKKVESVKQDFYATILLSNIETIFVDEVECELEKKSEGNEHSQKVNKAVSFNAIKNNVFDLFLNEKDHEIVFRKLNQLFAMNPVCERKQRDIPRKKGPIRRILNFYKRKKKECF